MSSLDDSFLEKCVIEFNGISEIKEEKRRYKEMILIISKKRLRN
jgi:hypothetical protein